MVQYTVKRTFIEVVVSPTSSEEGDELAFGHALTDGAVQTRWLKQNLSDEETSSEYEMASEATETSSACGIDKQPEASLVFEGEMTPWPQGECDCLSYGHLDMDEQAAHLEDDQFASRPEEVPASQQPLQPAEGFMQMFMPVSVQALPLQYQVLSLASALPPTPATTPPPTPQGAALPRPPRAAAAASSAILGGSSSSSLLAAEQPKERKPRVDPAAQAGRTTIMLRNLPNNYTRENVLRMLDEEGFAGLYDFLYLPMDFRTEACFGYCFVNLTSPEAALRCWNTFEGFSRWVLPSRKRCYVSWSGPHQGLQDNVEWYRGSAILHSSVPDEYKPVLFSGGVRVPFPAPKKGTRAPKARAAAAGAGQPGRRGARGERCCR